MDTQKMLTLVKHASQVHLMKFYVMDGRLHFQGLFAHEPWEKAATEELASELNAAITNPLFKLAEQLEERIRVEALRQ